MNKSNRLLILVATATIGLSGCGGSNGSNITAGGGTQDTNMNLVLTDADGNPIANTFWSVTGNASGDLSRGSSFLGFTDADGDTCSDPDSGTPQTADDSATGDGCTDGDGATGAILCVQMGTEPQERFFVRAITRSTSMTGLVVSIRST